MGCKGVYITRTCYPDAPLITGTREEVDGNSYEFTAVVGLLTRNILIQGIDADSAPAFGPRLLCSVMQELEEDEDGEMKPGEVNQCKDNT